MTRSNLNLDPHGVLTTRSADDADEDRGCSEAGVTCGGEAGLGVGGAGGVVVAAIPWRQVMHNNTHQPRGHLGITNPSTLDSFESYKTFMAFRSAINIHLAQRASRRYITSPNDKSDRFLNMHILLTW